ncbi:MAG: hypothetical protein NTW86_10500 [Candidatus Sumerlaeota bacterium]|nr:hypothetical protein [Candidatus Sumerlaeota bacterium]
MTSRAAWERDYRPHLLAVDRRRVKIEPMRESLRRRREQGPFTLMGQAFVWENMRQSMGDIRLYESLLDDPAWIHDYNRVHTDFCKAHYGLLFEEAGKPDGFRMCEDLGYRGGLFCSPRTLEQLIFPYYREIVDFFHSQGILVFLHACGNIAAALDLIVEAGFDGLDPMEAKAGCDALAFAERHADKLVFLGGLDARILEGGERDVIRRKVVKEMPELDLRLRRLEAILLKQEGRAEETVPHLQRAVEEAERAGLADEARLGLRALCDCLKELSREGEWKAALKRLARYRAG